MMVKTINNNLLMSVLEFHPDTTWNIPKQLSLYNLLQEEPGNDPKVQTIKHQWAHVALTNVGAEKTLLSCSHLLGDKYFETQTSQCCVKFHDYSLKLSSDTNVVTEENASRNSCGSEAAVPLRTLLQVVGPPCRARSPPAVWWAR